MLCAMATQPDLFYAAVKSRDARFDGRFFTAVKTTGIYCRSICPARTPLRKNVTFFACAAAAEEAGFRPCRRCRPESAPGTPVWLGPSATVSRALRLIERGVLDELGVDALAAQLGIGDRYLRRLFAHHLGTSPQAVAASRRAHFARVLLDASAQPVTQVALASGFHSVRQFNDVIRAVFGQTPTQLRAKRPRRDGDTQLRLAFRPPIAWDTLLGFLTARSIPGVERVEAGTYRRTFLGPAGPELLSVRLSADRDALELTVSGAAPVGLFDVVRRTRRLFDLDADPMAIAEQLRSAGLRLAPGLRVPGSWDTFETLVRAVLGQQISVAAATTLSGRLAQRFGVPFAGAPGLTHLFPTPAALARSDLSVIGLTGARAKGLQALSALVAKEPKLLSPAVSLEELIARLCALPGIGPWTAQYVAMRGFGEPDAFPSGDLILRRAAGDLTEKQLEVRSEAWRPWRAYAAIGLWTRYSEEKSHADRVLAS
jgi:AraC family transcriptional regulator of adaptative response / DNA-3-methyladenine glycosylase II